jgi:hypothetical protein
MVDPIGERLELRPNWAVIGSLIAGGILAFGIGARGWASLQAGSEDAWVVAGAGALMGVAAVAIAVRSRLILTPEGFRVRILWSGRLVPWSSVRRFEPDVFPRGLWWLPQERPTMPETLWQWLVAMWGQAHRSIPFFGRSRPFLLQTMTAWLEQYEGTSYLTPPGS